ALAIGVYGAIHFSRELNPYVVDFGISEKLSPILSFALTFILILIIVHLIAKLITKLIDSLSLSFLNKMGGGLFGAIKGILICTVILMYFNKINERFILMSEESKAESYFYTPLVNLGENVFPKIMDEYFPKKEPNLTE
ncbi:MAG: CvpA family protein, partial [Bacteroidota bacterium]